MIYCDVEGSYTQPIIIQTSPSRADGRAQGASRGTKQAAAQALARRDAAGKASAEFGDDLLKAPKPVVLSNKNKD